MRILFITDNFPPEVNAPATRTMEHCREWVKAGANVTVITGTPNFPHGKVFEGYRNSLYRKEMMDGIRVIRVWTFIAANKGFSKRILDYLSFAFMSFCAGLFVKADVIVATSPQFFTALSGCLLSFFKRTPWVFELRDLWPESIKAVDVIGHEGFLYRMLVKLELFMYRRADAIVALTESFKDNLVSRGIAAEKITVVKNGANINLFLPRERNAKIIRELGLEGKFVLGYIGTHGLAHGLDFILNSLAALKSPGLHLLLIGDGAEKKNLLKQARELKLENISFLDLIPKDQIAEYLSVIDISLVPLKKSVTFTKVIPSKIFESCAMRKPVLLGVEGESKRLIEQYNAGLCFEPGNEGEFVSQLHQMRTDTALYERLQLGCERLATDHDRKFLAAKMYAQLERLCAA